MTWLVTGGAGYIGQHVVRALLADGHAVTVLDNLSTGVARALPPAAALVVGDVCDPRDLDRALGFADMEGVVHLAALKSARGSLDEPLAYYRTNTGGTVELLEAMLRHAVRSLVFSSSCSVYGASGGLEPIDEAYPTVPVSPYGRSKLAAENVISDATAAYGLTAVALRYFNVAGSGSPDLGDRSDHNLIPQVVRAATNGTAPIIYGDTHGTPDGTCVRDYIDVRDLADAHVLAANLATQCGQGFDVFNVGTGEGHSVLQVIKAIGAAAGVSLKPCVESSRAGDPPSAVADGTRFGNTTGWKPNHGLADIAVSSWESRESTLQTTGGD
jgi:UDP-glucose 4-epimerase